MKNKFILLAVLALIIISGFTYSAEAVDSPYIKIDGELRYFDPPAQIINSRTMVPVRFVAEDKALGGEVFWDGSLQKVALNCRGKYIEFFIGSPKAAVDGKAVYLDSSPYIYKDRTYIPLRFFAENLGATVSWNAAKREVGIEFNKESIDKPQPERQEVFAYYYYHAFDEMKEYADLFTDIAFRWFATNSRGELYHDYNDNYSEILKFTHNKGIKAHASVVLMGKNSLHDLLSSKENRARLIANLLHEVKVTGYDGVNIDFEFIDPKDGPYFTIFLQELKQALGSDYPLSVAVFARTGNEKWPTPYEYEKIGQIADRVIVMAYDYHYATSSPGSVAPLWWVKQAAGYMSDIIPRKKLLLGVPTYGYDWSLAGGNATTVTARKLAIIKQNYRLTEHFDIKSMSPYYTYYDKYGNQHQIWMENEKSLKEKLKITQDYDLKGISFWRIGNGFTDLYNLLER